MSTQEFIGKPVNRVDGRRKVTGHARYAADFPVPNLAYAVGVQSPIAKGRITSIDGAKALAEPGVLGLLTHQNSPPLAQVTMEHQVGKPGQTFIPLQSDDVAYAGQYVAVIVADSVAAAEHAAALVKVSYEEQPAVIHMEHALGSSFEPKKMGRGDPAASDRGKPDEALASAAVKIDQTYTTPIENHNPMELSATIAAWDGDRLTLYDATQWVYGVRAVIASFLGSDQKNIRVIDPFVGGGFGCKGSIWPHEVLAALAAQHVGRPVKFVLTRSQMFTCIGYRPRTIQRVALGADAKGKLTATIHECTSQTSSWRDEWVETATRLTRMLYSCANVRTIQKLAAVNANTPTQMRAPGHATGTFALEVAMDELAAAVNVDPVELRLLNYAEMDEDQKIPFSSKALRECYRQGAERFGWSKRNPKPGSMRDGKTLIGWGMGTATYPTNRQPSGAKVRLSTDGRVVVSCAAHDLGTGTYTTLTQIAAETLGVPMKDVSVELADTVLPQAPVAGGSQTSASVGPAVKTACEHLIEALKDKAIADHASPLFNAGKEQIAVADGRIFHAQNPGSGEALADLLRRNDGKPVEGSTEAPPQKSSEKKPKPDFSKHAWGAQFVEVRIDPRLGEIRIGRAIGAFAAGQILNAKTARSQLMGGMVWGISAALMERTVYDPDRGKVVNDNLADYLVPVNADIPPIDVLFVEEKDEHVNSLGVKGIGELGITGIEAAIANAVFHATGKRLRDLPITLEQLL
jgi:xanthine dehydrogenase YagR molybdenum-binding subunit